MQQPVPQPWSDADIALLGDIYDLQCTSRMNAIYYGHRLGQLQREAFVLELFTAITATGSGVGAIAFWNSGFGSTLWQVLALLAALAAIIKPLRAPARRIEVFSRQQQAYHANFFALKKLARDLRQAGAVRPELREQFDACYDRHVQLSLEDEQTPDDLLRDVAQRAVARELPRDRFWWPVRAMPAAGPGEAIALPSPSNDPGTAQEPAEAPAEPPVDTRPWYVRRRG
jgi:hypothetical protein